MVARKATPLFSGEDFLKALSNHDYTFKVGQIVKGKVFEFDSRGFYVDIGGKSPGFLPMEEIVIGMDDVLEEVFAIGSEHEFLIVRDQDEDGEVKLSIRRLYVKKSWLNLQECLAENRVFPVKVLSANKGGLVAEVEGLHGFIPRSQLLERNDIEKLVGQVLPVMVLELDEERRRIILSHKQAAKTSALSQLGVGQLVSGTVSSLRPFGVFVELGGVSGLLHNKEISQKPIGDPARLFRPGDQIRAVITEIDESRNRITLSLKILELHPGEVLERLEQVLAEAEERLERNISQLWDRSTLS